MNQIELNTEAADVALTSSQKKKRSRKKNCEMVKPSDNADLSQAERDKHSCHSSTLKAKPIESVSLQTFNSKSKSEESELAPDVCNEGRNKQMEVISLLSKIRAMNIDTKKRMEEVVNFIYKKAVSEPNLCLEYALVCKELSAMTISKVNPEDKHTESFRRLIVDRCQKEFLKRWDSPELREETIEASPERKKSLNDDKKKMKMRKESVGYVRFLGEIFKQNMLTKKIMYFCINSLIQEKSEENLECLCILLKSIGKQLESNKDVKNCFKQMRDIEKNKPETISSRVLFMLKEVIDLRGNNWLPKKDKSNSKNVEKFLPKNETNHLNTQNTIPHNALEKEERVENQAKNQIGSLKSVNQQIKNNKLIKRVNELLCQLGKVRINILASEFLKLKVNTEEKMEKVIDLIFEKAVEDTDRTYSNECAVMCKKISSLEVSGVNSENTNSVNFNSLIINRCQHDFEKVFVIAKKEIKSKQIEACRNPEKLKELLLLKQERQQMRIKFICYMRFIGELFNLGILTKNIVHIFIKQLLENKEEEDLECLCSLLRTIGKNLEEDEVIRNCFKEMLRIVNMRRLSNINSKIRSRLKYLIMLRANKWVPIVNQNNFKIINKDKQNAETMQSKSQTNVSLNGSAKNNQSANQRKNRGIIETSNDGWSQLVKTSRAPATSKAKAKSPSIEDLQLRNRSINKFDYLNNLSCSDDEQVSCDDKCLGNNIHLLSGSSSNSECSFIGSTKSQEISNFSQSESVQLAPDYEFENDSNETPLNDTSFLPRRRAYSLPNIFAESSQIRPILDVKSIEVFWEFVNDLANNMNRLKLCLDDGFFSRSKEFCKVSKNLSLQAETLQSESFRDWISENFCSSSDSREVEDLRKEVENLRRQVACFEGKKSNVEGKHLST